MEDSRRQVVDRKDSDVVRPLIKHKKGIGGFMKFFPAYVPTNQTWIVFADNQVFKKDLSEKDATDLAYLLNESRWNQKTLEKDAQVARELAAVLDVERVYQVFPRKLGKKIGVQRLKSKIKTPEKLQLCIEAALNYKRYCEDNRIEEKFIKHFSTWVNSWEDWIPEDTEVSSLPQLSFDDITKRIQISDAD